MNYTEAWERYGEALTQTQCPRNKAEIDAILTKKALVEEMSEELRRIVPMAGGESGKVLLHSYATDVINGKLSIPKAIYLLQRSTGMYGSEY